MEYPNWKLFTALEFKGRVLKNRLMRSAMVVAMADGEGFITSDNLNWYRKAAEGGVGFLVTEAMAVHPRGRIFPTQISAYGEERLPGLKKLADTIHAHGAGVFVAPQIHSGGAHDWGYSYGQRDTGLGLDVIEEKDITEIIAAFAESAFLVKRAGFDGVQLHGGHGYLMAQFLSPATNKRTDKWGGSPENRLRFPLEIYKGIREKVGADFPVGIKMNTADYLDGGNWVPDTAAYAKQFAEVGFDFIEMSGGMGFMTELREALRQKVGEKEFYFRDAIPLFREAVQGSNTLLAGCGGIRTPQVMEDLLHEGLDVVSLARPWLSEPNLAKRMRAGDLRTARCVSGSRLCNLCLTKVAKGSSTCVKFFPGDCLQTCPIEQDNPTYFAFIAQRRFAEALAVVKRDNPFAGVLSRVCHHPCETICRSEDGEPVAIMSLKRFITDWGIKHNVLVKADRRVEGDGWGKVAIIGSGPAGLTCAYYLAQRGYAPTVFEKLAVKGGMLAVGIPRYKLPEAVLTADLAYIESAGVEIKTGVALGKDFSLADLFAEGYQAVFVAVGTPLSTKLDIEGTTLAGVIPGLDFLKAVNMKESVEVGKRVVVIGGGNVAVGAAMTALRLGAEDVQVVCLESRAELPAYHDEVADAEAEGVIFNFSWGPKRITGEGTVSGVEFVRCVSVFDEAGKWNPRFKEAESTFFQADTVIIAIGQSPDRSFLGKDNEIKVNAQGTVAVNPLTLETTLAGVFAGGDSATGSKNVVDAVAAGKEAAESIDRYLQGRSVVRSEKPREFITIERPTMFADPSARILKENSLRAVPPKLSVTERKGTFQEIVGCFSEDDAVREAKRCLKYDLELEGKSRGRMAKMGKATFVLEP